MPSGKTHERIALISLFPTFLAGYYFFNDIGLASFLALFTLIGAFLLGPDLDTKSSTYYRWGIFRLIWLPYRKFVRHRSLISHSFIVGPLLKMLYLLIFVILMSGIAFYFVYDQNLLMLFGHQKSSFHQMLINYKLYIIIAFAGILWANAQHLITDYIVSFCSKK